MPIVWNEKERILPLSEVQIDGAEGGMVEDMKYRPNKYFHPVEDVRLEGQRWVLLYQKELFPVEGKVSLEQVKHLLRGVIDAQQKLAQDQVFYLYPSVEAFGQDRRRNLRVGLINARPFKDWERSPQEMCVDAFSDLIAEHSPEGHKRVTQYKQKILTLRHLLQVLEGRFRRSWWSSLVLLLIGLVGLVGLLYQWGPPRVRQAIGGAVDHSIQWGRRMVRTSTQQWDVSLRKERRRWEYRHEPMAVSLILHPQSSDPQERQRIHAHLLQVLSQEFDVEPRAQYQLLVPDPKQFPEEYQKRILLPSRFPKLMQQWKVHCAALYRNACPPQSWLLTVSNYRGGFRPLVDAVKEAMTRDKKGGVTLRYRQAIGAVSAGWAAPQPAKADAKTQTGPNKAASHAGQGTGGSQANPARTPAPRTPAPRTPAPGR